MQKSSLHHDGNASYSEISSAGSRNDHNMLSSLPDEEIVTLNVGGELYTTTVATLRWTNDVIGDHFLRILFTAEFGVKTDSQGRVFIDRNGTRFEWILDFLRNQARSPMPSHPEEAALMRLEMEYFGLHLILNKEKSVQRDADIQGEQKELVSREAGSFVCYLELPCRVQIKRWVLRVQNPFGIRVTTNGQDVRFTSKGNKKTTSNRIIFKKWSGDPIRRNSFTHEAWTINLEANTRYAIHLEALNDTTPILTQSLKSTTEEEVEFANNYSVLFVPGEDGFNGLFGLDFDVLEW